jgi:hypothetical protein
MSGALTTGCGADGGEQATSASRLADTAIKRIGIEFGVMVESGPASIGSAKQGPPAGGQGSWDERRLGRDEPREPVTGGGLSGLSGDERRALLIGWAVGAPIVLAVTAFNILTRLHDNPAQGALRPIWDEVSSAITTLVAFAGPAVVAVWMRRRRPPWWRAAPVHALALIAYSAVHVGGFVVLRAAGFALVGAPYHFGPVATEVPYEFAKDVVAYAIALAAFWLMLRWSWPSAPPETTWSSC